MGDADDGPAGVLMEGAANGAAPGGGGGGGGGYDSLEDNDLPPDFDAEPVENFEPTKPATVAATTDDAATAAAVGDDDDMD